MKKLIFYLSLLYELIVKPLITALFRLYYDRQSKTSLPRIDDSLLLCSAKHIVKQIRDKKVNASQI
jgi:hypothetical protein